VTIDNSQLPTTDPISDLNPTKIPLADRILQVETHGSDSRSVLEQLWQLERSRTAEFADYLGLSATTIERDLLLVQIQDTLRQIEVDPGRKAAMIYVTVTEEALELLLVSAHEPPRRYSIAEAKREHLFPVVSRLFDYITAVSFRNTNAYLNPSQQLYEWIFSPLAEDLERLEINTLLLSLDAGLRSVPMAALHDGDRFLIEQYSLSLIPSFSLANLEYSPRSDSDILAMGASEFRDRRPLPAVPTELSLIQQSAKNSITFLNEDFTIENFARQQQERNFEIVHFATHADFTPGTPDTSFIQLCDDRLNLQQLPQLNLNNPPANLLVLSACRTALGDREAELGFGGLAVRSGARSALASLWNVSDEGTLVLMGEFYHRLMGNNFILKSEALQQAQIAVLRGDVRLENGQLITGNGAIDLPPEIVSLGNQRLHHPYYWSGFTIVGSPW